MPETKIKYPRKVKTKLWFASGTTEVADTNIQGEFRDGKNKSFAGELLFNVEQRLQGGQRRWRWVMLFLTPGAASGNGVLRVWGANNPADQEPVEIPEDLPGGPAAKVTPKLAITIDASIEDEEEIPADGFIAFGSIGGASLALVTMNDTGADWTMDDPVEGFWVAQFPTLEVGSKYKLRAYDSLDNLAVRRDLLATV